MDMEELVSAIYALDDEDDLTNVWHAYHDRFKQLRARRAAKIGATLKVGTRFVVSDQVRPKRYAGMRGVVTGRHNTKWAVKLDDGEELVVGASALRLEEES